MNTRDEWAEEVRRMGEWDRLLAVEEPRWALGVTGDPEDAS